MIDNLGHGQYEVECDDCGHTQTYVGIEDWSALMAEMKGDGWRTRKHGDKWEHTCETCEQMDSIQHGGEW